MATANLKLKTAKQLNGFTLIELAVVITVLSLLALLVMPRLPSAESGRLRESARSLAAAIRYLEDRAVTVKMPYRLHLDLDDSTVSVKLISPSGEETAPDDVFFSRRFLANGIRIEDVELARLGKVSAGEVTLDFGPGGLEEFLVIHLLGSRGDRMTVMAYPQSGKVKISEGYQEALR